MFDPDDFYDRPYVGGLNQLGHAGSGAALIGPLSMIFAMSSATLLAFAAVFAWEARQYLVRGATWQDCVADFIYWSAGIASWGLLIHYGLVNGYGVLWPVLLLLVWLTEYIRLSLRVTFG